MRCGEFIRCMPVVDMNRVEAKVFKAPYSPELKTVREELKRGLGRVFYFEDLSERFNNPKLSGVWRVWLGLDGHGSWTNLSLPAPRIVRSLWNAGAWLLPS